MFMRLFDKEGRREEPYGHATTDMRVLEVRGGPLRCTDWCAQGLLLSAAIAAAVGHAAVQHSALDRGSIH